MATITVNYTALFGQSVRIGYRVQNSGNPFVYPMPFPTYADSPYLITGVALGSYEVEITSVCPNCSGAQYGYPTIYPAISQ